MNISLWTIITALLGGFAMVFFLAGVLKYLSGTTDGKKNIFLRLEVCGMILFAAALFVQVVLPKIPFSAILDNTSNTIKDYKWIFLLWTIFSR